MNEDLACASFATKVPSSHSSPGRHTLLLRDLFKVSNALDGDQDASELGSLTNPMPSYDRLWYNDQPTFACITVYFTAVWVNISWKQGFPLLVMFNQLFSYRAGLNDDVTVFRVNSLEWAMQQLSWKPKILKYNIKVYPKIRYTFYILIF